MVVLWAREIGRGRRRSRWTDIDRATREQERTYVRTWQVKTSDPTDTALVALNAPGIPDLWDDYPGDDTAVAIHYDVDETEDPEHWFVSVEYGFSLSPASEPAVIRCSTGQQERALEQDVTGRAAVNSALDPYDPPLTTPEPYLILTVQKNFLPIEVDLGSLVAVHLFHTNSVAFNTPRGSFPFRTVWLADYQETQEFRNGVSYLATSWTFWIRDRVWTARVLDAGYRWLNPTNGQSVIIRGADNQPVSSPALLDGAGGILPPGSPPHYLEFQIYDEADFNLLNLFT